VGWLLRIRCHCGNSKGMIIPAALLEQAGLESEADVRVEEGALIVRAPAKSVRSGWAEASAELARHGDDALLIDDIVHDGDQDLVWQCAGRSDWSI
jgi:antitoxin MazE